MYRPMLRTDIFSVAQHPEMKPPSHARIPVALETAKFPGEI